MSTNTKKMIAGLALATAAVAMVGEALAQAAFFRVNADDTNVHRIYGYAGVPISIEVDGDGDTDLDLYLFDENGNLVDWDTDTTDYCLGYVTPVWSGPFTIEVKNLGGVYNLYRLSVNHGFR